MSYIACVPNGYINMCCALSELQKKKKKATEDVNHSQLAQACKNLGDYYTQEGDYKKALKEYRQEADIHNRSKNKLKHAVANRWIGESYMALEEFDEALKHVETYLSGYSTSLEHCL